MLEKQAHADAFFARSANKLDFGNWSEEEKVALSCRILASEGHSETLAGQITVRKEDGTFLTTPLAQAFDEIIPASVIRINDNMEVLDGPGTPNPAVRFHFWVYRQRPDVQCIIHTHPPHVSTLSMTGQPLVVAHMDATPFHNDCAHLKEWPGLPIADQEGEIISRRWAASAASCWPTTAFWQRLVHRGSAVPVGADRTRRPQSTAGSRRLWRGETGE